MLNLEEGQVFDSQYELIRLVDTGGFTEVWEARYLVAGNTVALKVYPKLDEEGIRNIEEEYKRLFELQHSNLLSVLHFGRFNGYPYLVMRYYPGGNGSRKIGSCSEAEIAKCLSQIGGVLKYLHANSIIHQDIKPNNFLLDQYGNYYLADLGLSLKVRDTIKMFTQTKSSAGTEIASIQSGITPPPYRAPELYDRQRGNKDPLKATDVWALGASLYEMITSDPPFGDLGGLMQMNDPVVGNLPVSYSRDLDKLLKSCLEKDPSKRPTAAELEKKACAFIENGEWQEKKEAPKGTNPLLIVAVTILLMVVGVFAIKRIIRPDKPIIVAGDTTTTHAGVKDWLDTTKFHPMRILRPDSTRPSVRDSTKKMNWGDIFKVKDGGAGSQKAQQGQRSSERGAYAATIDYPVVGNKPRGSCPPTIVRVSRSKYSFTVLFHIAPCTGTISLYPPGNEQAYYVQSSDRRIYKLTSIDQTGQDLTVPSRGLYFTATFYPLDESVRQVDILQGENQLDRTASYYNFMRVELTK